MSSNDIECYGFLLNSASTDNIRLWNVAEAGEPDAVSGRMKSGVQFKIIPGHHGGTISQLRMYCFSSMPLTLYVADVLLRSL